MVLQNSVRFTVPWGPGVACSIAKAIKWDARWSNNLDPSGRAVLGVHVWACDFILPTSLATEKTPAKMVNLKPRMVQVALQDSPSVPNLL